MNLNHTHNWRTMDANEAVASVAYRMSELVAIYPITPSSPMAEHCDAWASKGKVNLFGGVPEVVEMQSEGGVAGAVHGSLTGGVLTTTFTASQGLLLMVPDLFKIAGELTPFVIHVAARAIATHALSIFGDHSDVMTCRGCGLAMLASANVQEAQDMAAIAHAATLSTRVPFMHFFDGFRTSHEINKIQTLGDNILHSLMDLRALDEFRRRGLTPDHPTLRGTAQNPDAFFQGREAANIYYNRCVDVVEQLFTGFAILTGRSYHPFEYEGSPEAENVIVIMGSGAETAAETAKCLAALGEKTGVVKVRMYRPFDKRRFLEALPRTTKRIAVLDRTKEPGSCGEPLLLDVVMALSGAAERGIRAIGGRYGLGSKEFDPAMVRAVFDALDKGELKEGFTIGIIDDVSGLSVPWDNSFRLPMRALRAAMFYGLGSDGTVGANKNTIKIIGEDTPLFAQGYFVYDSKKSGGLTVSHLRFGPEPIRAPYLVRSADFIGVHQPSFLATQPQIFDSAAEKAALLINFSGSDEDLWRALPTRARRIIRERKCRLYRIDASKVARDNGMGRHINVVMQAAFFAVSEILPLETALSHIKEAIRKSYSAKGEDVVQKNCAAAMAGAGAVSEVVIPSLEDEAPAKTQPLRKATGNAFVDRVTIPLIEGRGDELPVSAFPIDGTWPTGTSRYEKRGIADFIPVWNPEACTQCNQCVQACPHAAIRSTFVKDEALSEAPEAFKSIAFKGPGSQPGEKFVIQVSPLDCTGCRLCVAACPRGDVPEGKPCALKMEALDEERKELGTKAWDFFEELSPAPKERLAPVPRSLAMRKPLFEFSGACSGCGQTPYVRTLTQLFGDRLLMANATGCSSIYGGNLPTTPYTVDENGRGPAWANSLFEDNAEFGYGLMLSTVQRKEHALRCLSKLSQAFPRELVDELLNNPQESDEQVEAARCSVQKLREALSVIPDSRDVRELASNADYLVKKSVWIMGGDGWAYDIGFGGLDHVLASGRNVNVLVLDTEVYSNTGGQQSKSTPIGATARFATAGKAAGKKDLAGIAMSYPNVYVAQICIGANQRQALDVLKEAESYDGPSLVIAYAPCLEHGIDLSNSLDRQKLAIKTGYWNLFRRDPRLEATADLFRLDSAKPSLPVIEFMQGENRFRKILSSDNERAHHIVQFAQEFVDTRYERLLKMSGKA
ncbi:MAG: pyruvate:ferredoxin (flavodoxin) oxidoreductase [Opitutales bacterium]|nr:pyruvate:ferredoxin (flavodoxin) oxidoreductase [Opitutales bacterium]